MGRVRISVSNVRTISGLILLICAVLSPWSTSAQDTTPPQWIAATGSAGDTTLTFWFDEAVDSTSVVSAGNISLTGGLTVGLIKAIGSNSGSWNSGAVMSYNYRDAAIGVINDSIYIAAGEGDNPRLEVYDPVSDTWIEKAPPPTRVEPAAWGVIGGKFYLAGGDYNGTLKDSLHIYDPVTDSWNSGARMQVARRWSAGGVIDGKLYVVGGYSAFQGYENTLEIYDPGSDSWSYGASMLTAREVPAGGVIDGKLYVAGGKGSQGILDVLEVYDPVTDSWTRLAAMPTPRMESAGAVLHGQLYVLGGNNNGILGSVVSYNPYSDQWKTVDPLPTAKYSFSAVGFGSSIYNPGGDSGSGWLNTLDIYHLPTQVFRLGLGTGEILPAPATPVTLTASNISDLSSNTIPAPIDTTFLPTTGGEPSVALYSPAGGTQSGNAKIPFQITDGERNPVTLAALFSADGSVWSTATVNESLVDIPASGYTDTLTWQSGIDHPGEAGRIWFKLTPRDNAVTTGTADSTIINVDNKAPEWVSVTGSAGDTTISFWFDELVETATATNATNITLSGGLTVDQITNGGNPLDQWDVIDTQVPVPRRGFFSGAIDNRIFIIGGDSYGTMTNRVDIYDHRDNSWVTGTPMPTPRYFGTSAVYNGKLYTFGGMLSGGGYTNVVEIYDPVTDSWSTGTSMPVPRQGSIAGVINDRIYIAGGENATGMLDALDIYNPGSDTWTSGSNKPRWSVNGAAGVIDGKLYVAAGHDGPPNNYLDVYDPRTNSWTMLPPLSVNRQGPGASVWDGKLYVTGGGDSETWNTTEVFDPATNTWSAGPSFSRALPDHHTEVAGGSIFIISGPVAGPDSTIIEELPFIPGKFLAELIDGQSVPNGDTPVTLTASNISDLHGNTATSLDTTFSPSTDTVPSIALSGPSGTDGGDISIEFQITDTESNPVSLAASYSTDGSIWSSATITGPVSDIPSTSYQDTLIWQSRTDLVDQELDQVWFRITPSDNATTPGTPDSISFGLDNKPPEWVAASGDVGDSTITVWFNEVVDEAIASTPANYSLSQSLAVDSVSVAGVGTGVWNSSTSLPQLTRHGVCATIDNKIYLIIGEGGPPSSLHIYDVSIDVWSLGSPMPSYRWEAVAAVLDGKIYVVGGNDQNGHNNSLEVYDPVSDLWEIKAPIPVSMYGGVAGAIDGKLYVAGGAGDGSWDVFQVYDPSTNSWTSRAPVIEGLGAAMGGVIDGKLYAVGGYVQSDTYLRVYDPGSNTWELKTPMPTGRYIAGTAIVSGKLYILGGFSNDTSLQYDTVEAYDPVTDSWTTLPAMPKARHALCATAVGGTIYVLGGDNDAEGWIGQVDALTVQAERFDLHLVNDQYLPLDPVSVTALSIQDLYGNVATSLDTIFSPSTGEVPSISLGSIGGIRSGEVRIPFQISDMENNPVSLTAGYSSDGGLSWHAATVTGTTTYFHSSSYQDTLVWQSRTDLPGQEFDQVWFKVTPSDNASTSGVPDSISFGLDNKPPERIAAEGAAGDTTITFWFDEAVDSGTATIMSNYSISGGLSIASIRLSDKWQERVAIDPVMRVHPGIGVYDDKIYVFGGVFDESYSLFMSTVEVYDPEQNTWTDLSAMPTPRATPSVVTIGNSMYVFGGIGTYVDDSYYASQTLEVYHPDTDSWDSISVPYALGQGNAVEAINGQIYVSHWDNTVRKYDPESNQWEDLPVAYAPKLGEASGVIGGKWFLAGGGLQGSGDFSADLTIIDPITYTVTSGAPMPTARHSAVGAVIGNKFYVIGGNTPSGSTDVIEIYDPSTNSWSNGNTDPVVERCSGPGIVIDDRLFLTRPEDVLSLRRTVFHSYAFSEYQIVLQSGQQLPFELITLQATGIRDHHGNGAGTLSVDFVPNDENDNPTISLDTIGSEVYGNVSIGYTISDTEGDPCDLSPIYSIDGGSTWSSATTDSDTVGIDSGSYTGALIWQSSIDLPNFEQEDLKFRISVIDNAIEIGVSDEITFHLDNNEVPAADITDAVLAVSDTSWTFSFTLSDAESDTLTLLAEYSADSGNTWHEGSVSGISSSITSGSYTGSLKWFAGRDLPGATQEVLFRITPSDRDAGTPDVESVFVNSLGVPTVDITSDLSSEQSGDITIEFEADDINGDPLDLIFEYEYPADTWEVASVTGSASLAGPAEYSSSIVWHSGTDLAGLDIASVPFKITPSDAANTGMRETVSLHVDNNDPPSISLTSPTGTLGRDIQIDCQLADGEGDTLEIAGWWSPDQGVNWQPMSFDGTLTGLLPVNYSQTITWQSFDDCGYGTIDTVLVRLVAADHDPGTEAQSDYFTVTNHVGDYNGDVAVDFSDFATLVTAWNDQNTYHDIGPATGSIPDLVPAPDGVIDFEDLTVYLQMWTWSAAQAPQGSAESSVPMTRPGGSEPARSVTPESAGTHPVYLEQPEPDDLWAPDNRILDLHLNAREISGLTSAGAIIRYDTSHLKLLNLQSGTFMGRVGGRTQNLLEVTRADEEQGIIEVMYGRIDQADPEVSGSGLLASLQFEKLTTEDSVVEVRYDLRDREAETITSGQFRSSVTARWIPAEFELLQNYPNPFNGETTIRFQLPTERRVQLYLYNIRGQRVATILDAQMDAGYHRVTWNGRNDDGVPVSSGIY
ncbi:kelch repeat-containing protein, partial [Gemmatimonadota bacterium]